MPIQDLSAKAEPTKRFRLFFPDRDANYFSAKRLGLPDEKFVLVGNAEDAKAVDLMNGPAAAAVKADRLRHIREHGTVHEAELPDVNAALEAEIRARLAEAY
jgi:hypothetical protein